MPMKRNELVVKNKSINRIFPEEPIDQFGRHTRKEKRSEFAEWFYKNGQDKILSHKVCGQFLAKMLNRDISLGSLRSYIGFTREYLEKTKKVTIWSIQGEGWRVATEKQKAVHLIRAARRTISIGERTVRLYGITEKALIPAAIKEVFGTSGKALKQVEAYSGKFNQLFSSGVMKKSLS